MVGWRDVRADLSDSAALKKLRQSLPARALLVSSDLGRARQTADAVAGPGHKRLPNDPHLREIHFGQWDGRDFDAVSARDPVLSRRFWESPGDVRAPDGESWDMASARVQTAVQRLNARYPGATFIAVAHFGAILTQVQRARGVSAYETLAQHIDNLSVTTVVWSEGAARLERVNHQP
jgi:broad specificity phosphatase PhoE